MPSAIAFGGGDFRHSAREPSFARESGSARGSKSARGTKLAGEAKSGSRLKVALTFCWHHRGNVAIFAMASCVAGAILVNALFLQSARHPAPWFGTATEPKAAVAAVQEAAKPMPRPRPAAADSRDQEPAKPVMTTAPATRSAPAAKPVAAAVQRENVSRDDPIAERIAATQRVATVQRALSEFGYGQIKPTGVAGPDTQAAIEKFERERMMPVTGKISARMLRELSAITGRVFD